jgi:hypothetical protein
MADEETELSNVFEGHVLPRRQVGDLNIINLALFNPDGSPFALPVIPEAEPVGEWVELEISDLGNGWGILDPANPPAYRKRPDNVVEMRGMFDPGIDGSTIFTFPPAYRHTAGGAQMFACAASEGKQVNLVVNTNGTVTSYNLGDGTSVNGMTWVNPSNIRYSVDD